MKNISCPIKSIVLLRERTFVFRNKHASDVVTLEQVSVPIFWFDSANRHYLNVTYSFLCQPGVKKLAHVGPLFQQRRSCPIPRKKKNKKKTDSPLVASNLTHSIEAPLFLIWNYWCLIRCFWAQNPSPKCFINYLTLIIFEDNKMEESVKQMVPCNKMASNKRVGSAFSIVSLYSGVMVRDEWLMFEQCKQILFPAASGGCANCEQCTN